MNRTDAEDIAARLVSAWHRSAITAYAWTTELVDLERARAEEACRQLVRSEELPPSIARFLAKYRDLAGTAGRDPAGECGTCGGAGWAPDTDVLHPDHHGYWRERRAAGLTACTVPTFLREFRTRDDDGVEHLTVGPDPAECICEIQRPCPRCPRGARVAALNRNLGRAAGSSEHDTTDEHADPAMF